MSEKTIEKTFLESEMEDARDFAEIIKKIPEGRKKDAKFILEGFALCASSEQAAV